MMPKLNPLPALGVLSGAIVALVVSGLVGWSPIEIVLPIGGGAVGALFVR